MRVRTPNSSARRRRRLAAVVLLPLPAFIAVTLIVLCVMLAGFAGPPARRPRPRLAWALFAVGVAGLGLSAWLVYAGGTALGFGGSR